MDRLHGGRRQVLEPRVYKVLYECYCNALANHERKLDAWDAIKEVAKKTGKVISYNTVRRFVLKYNELAGLNVKPSRAGLERTSSIFKLQKMLLEEGIKAVP